MQSVTAICKRTVQALTKGGVPMLSLGSSIPLPFGLDDVPAGYAAMDEIVKLSK